MQNPTNFNPWWAALVTWGVVNLVNILQATGFVSRVLTGSMRINHLLGFAMIALAVPLMAALAAFVHAGAGWLYRIGPLLYIAFIMLMVVVDYLWPVEFRSPARLSILIPFLVLFFGSILFMGLPMFYLDRRLWLVTVLTTLVLLGSMIWAMRKGVA